MILVLSVSLLIFTIGFFAFYVVYSEIGYSTEQTESFTITTPSVNQNLELTYYPTSITLVEQYNGFEWKTIPSAGYSNDGFQVTVNSSYLEG